MAQRTEARPASWSPVLVGLYEQNYHRLVCAAERIVHDRALAEECVQDAFMTYHVKQSAPAAGKELGYLRSMVRNGAISLVRRERRYLEVALAGEVPVAVSAEAVAVATLTAGRIFCHLASLAPRQGAVIAHRLNGCSVAETAQLMAVTSGTVKQHRHRAAEAMRVSLSEFVAA